jgi:hypothetical protein
MMPIQPAAWLKDLTQAGFPVAIVTQICADESQYSRVQVNGQVATGMDEFIAGVMTLLPVALELSVSGSM